MEAAAGAGAVGYMLGGAGAGAGAVGNFANGADAGAVPLLGPRSWV